MTEDDQKCYYSSNCYRPSDDGRESHSKQTNTHKTAMHTTGKVETPNITDVGQSERLGVEPLYGKAKESFFWGGMVSTPPPIKRAYSFPIWIF
jgi:hypothetical protein